VVLDIGRDHDANHDADRGAYHEFVVQYQLSLFSVHWTVCRHLPLGAHAWRRHGLGDCTDVCSSAAKLSPSSSIQSRGAPPINLIFVFYPVEPRLRFIHDLFFLEPRFVEHSTVCLTFLLRPVSTLPFMLTLA
jgi:hypothetical protein